MKNYPYKRYAFLLTVKSTGTEEDSSNPLRILCEKLCVFFAVKNLPQRKRKVFRKEYAKNTPSRDDITMKSYADLAMAVPFRFHTKVSGSKEIVPRCNYIQRT